MIFTIISMLLSAFEYFSAKKFINVRTGIVVSFIAKSQSVESMSGRYFVSKIVFGTHSLNGYVGKLLNVDFREFT